MIERFITQLSNELELEEELKPQSVGVYRLPLDHDLVVTLSEKEGVISFHSPIAECPDKNQEFFFEKLLLANLFGQGTYGSVLGLDEEGKNIVLQRTFSQPLDYRQFRDHLEDFINAVDLWRQEATAPTDSELPSK